MRATMPTAALLAAALLTSCSISGSDDTGPTDTMTFCAQLGAHMMSLVDQTHTPDPARAAESDQEMQGAADHIAATEDGYAGLGSLTREFLTSDDQQTAATAHAGLQLYCNRHNLSPFPQS